MKKHLLAIALFALCTTGLNAASPKKVTPEKKRSKKLSTVPQPKHISAFWPVTNWKDAKPDGKVDALQAIISFPA